MTLAVVFSCLAGILVGVSRQINGRLSLSTSPQLASLCNHTVGFVLLTVFCLLLSGFIPAGVGDAPLCVFLGGPIGVVFVAASSWIVARIGAINTALLVISGQMVSGVIIDVIRASQETLWIKVIGVILILAGMAVIQRR